MVQPSPHPAPAPLLSAADVRRIAAELDLRPTKQWGQNFVIDPNTIRRIVQAADVTADEHVLEIGPGLGSLTLGLLDAAAAVTAVEIDPVTAARLPRTAAEFRPGAEDALAVLHYTSGSSGVLKAAMLSFGNRKALIRKKYVHVGFAVDTPDGLMVPVIRNVDQKSLLQLAGEAAELAEKARTKKLSPDAMQGACFTISSLGHIGGTGFTPIVNAPEVAILGVSKAAMQPVWDGKAFQPRLMLPLSLSYDHRVINGAAAARFTKRLSELLADIRTMLL